MDPSNKIDLNSVNKPKNNAKLLKKTQGPLRDEEGKFAATTGGGGLKSSQNFSWKRAAPLIAVVALVGGFFVYSSFAASFQSVSSQPSSSGALAVNNTYTYQEISNKDYVPLVDPGKGGPFSNEQQIYRKRLQLCKDLHLAYVKGDSQAAKKLGGAIINTSAAIMLQAKQCGVKISANHRCVYNSHQLSKVAWGTPEWVRLKVIDDFCQGKEFDKK